MEPFEITLVTSSHHPQDDELNSHLCLTSHRHHHPKIMSILPLNQLPSSNSSSAPILLLHNNFCLLPTSRGPFTFTFPSVSVRVRASLSSSSSSDTQQTQTWDAVTGASLDQPSSPPPESFRQSRRSADWKAARTYNEKGMIYQGRIEGFNNGGLLIRFYSLIGFLPFPQLSPSHTYKGPRGRISEVASGLVGSLVSVKIIQVNEENRLLIFSEKEAAWAKYSVNVNAGDVFQGVVGSVEDYGAFIHLKFPDGSYPLTGLVHISEVSWDLVQDVRDVLSKGDGVRVKVLNVDRAKSRITLSIKQLQDDPFFETLDKVISLDGSAVHDSADISNTSNIEPLPGLETIFNELLKEEGIEGLRINRQGFERRVVSQDLQLWLSNAPPMDNKFVLLARAGRQVQEIQLTTSLDQEGIKKALQRVLERVP